MARKWEYRNIHYQGMTQIEKKTDNCNKFRLYVDGKRVNGDGSKDDGKGIIVLPSETDWKYECHHLVSTNASARVLLLKPETDVIRKIQIVLPIDANNPTSHSKAFVEVMEACANQARLLDGAVVQINLEKLFGALNTNEQAAGGGNSDGIANFLAALDPHLFGDNDDSSSDEEEEDWN